MVEQGSRKIRRGSVKRKQQWYTGEIVRKNIASESPCLGFSCDATGFNVLYFRCTYAGRRIHSGLEFVVLKMALPRSGKQAQTCRCNSRKYSMLLYDLISSDALSQGK